jgi:hypothetical protein
VSDSPFDIVARLSADSDGLALNFYRHGDRYGHFFGHGEELPVLTSVDLSAEMETESGPASPVFQEVHEEELPQGPSLMTVGQWGKIHYSAVFLQQNGGRFDCDIAARVRSATDLNMASTYTLRATAIDLTEISSESIVCRLGQGRTLRISTGPGTELVMTTAGHAGLRIQIFPSKAAIPAGLPGASSRTIRWSYAIELEKTTEM